jgi:hypothetical protein
MSFLPTRVFRQRFADPADQGQMKPTMRYRAAMLAGNDYDACRERLAAARREEDDYEARRGAAAEYHRYGGYDLGGYYERERVGLRGPEGEGGRAARRRPVYMDEYQDEVMVSAARPGRRLEDLWNGTPDRREEPAVLAESRFRRMELTGEQLEQMEHRRGGAEEAATRPTYVAAAQPAARPTYAAAAQPAARPTYVAAAQPAARPTYAAAAQPAARPTSAAAAAGPPRKSFARPGEEMVTLPWKALTPNMPNLHLPMVPGSLDCEDIAAALLAHWGVPAEITVYRQIGIFDESDGAAVCGHDGRPLQRHRWRRVTYDEEGNPVRVAITAMTPYPQGGRDLREFSYEEERRVFASVMKDVVGEKEPEAAEAGETGEANEAAAGESGGDDAISEAESLIELGSLSAEPAPEKGAMLAWGGMTLRHDGYAYKPLNKNFAIVKMARWYTTTEQVRRDVINDLRVRLPVDSAQTTNWSFFLCGLGRMSHRD